MIANSGIPSRSCARRCNSPSGLVVQRSRILRTRAKFDEWGVRFIVEVDQELVDKAQLSAWLDIAGRRIGLGDWRPEKSGHYGRFQLEAIETLSILWHGTARRGEARRGVVGHGTAGQGKGIDARRGRAW